MCLQSCKLRLSEKKKMTSLFAVTILCQLEDISETSHHFDFCKIMHQIMCNFEEHRDDHIVHWSALRPQNNSKIRIKIIQNDSKPVFFMIFLCFLRSRATTTFTRPKGLTHCGAAYSIWKLAMDLKPLRKSRAGMRFLPASWRSRTSSHSSVVAT